MYKKIIGLTSCLFMVGVCTASGSDQIIRTKPDVEKGMIIMLDEQMYKLTPIEGDPIEQFSKLSPRSRYAAACDHLKKDSDFEKNLGARLMVSLVNDGNVTALEYLNLTCDIQDPTTHSIEDLMEIIIRKSA